MIKSSNQELMAGKILSHGEMIDYSTWGEKWSKKQSNKLKIIIGQCKYTKKAF